MIEGRTERNNIWVMKEEREKGAEWTTEGKTSIRRREIRIGIRQELKMKFKSCLIKRFS